MSYTRQIPPGGEGTIQIKVNTKGFGGRNLKKNIRVITNDQDNKQFNLTVTGPVEAFVTIFPPRVRLSGPAGEQLAATVSIVPEKKYPFKIKDVKARDGQHIRWVLLDSGNKDVPGYRLKIENTKKETGRYFDMLYLQTDSKIRPEITVRVFGHIFEAKTNDKKPDAGKTVSG